MVKITQKTDLSVLPFILRAKKLAGKHFSGCVSEPKCDLEWKCQKCGHETGTVVIPVIVPCSGSKDVDKIFKKEQKLIKESVKLFTPDEQMLFVFEIETK